MQHKVRSRRTVRLRLALAGGVALVFAGAFATPSSAAGYCVSVYPQSTLGVTVCIPWGG